MKHVPSARSIFLTSPLRIYESFDTKSRNHALAHAINPPFRPFLTRAYSFEKRRSYLNSLATQSFIVDFNLICHLSFPFTRLANFRDCLGRHFQLLRLVVIVDCAFYTFKPWRILIFCFCQFIQIIPFFDWNRPLTHYAEIDHGWRGPKMNGPLIWLNKFQQLFLDSAIRVRSTLSKTAAIFFP